jgi:hypothetical protein
MTKQEAQQTLCKLVGEVSSKLDPNRDKPTCICNLGRYKNNDVDAEAIANHSMKESTTLKGGSSQ